MIAWTQECVCAGACACARAHACAHVSPATGVMGFTEVRVCICAIDLFPFLSYMYCDKRVCEKKNINQEYFPFLFFIIIPLLHYFVDLIGFVIVAMNCNFHCLARGSEGKVAKVN